MASPPGSHRRTRRTPGRGACRVTLAVLRTETRGKDDRRVARGDRRTARTRPMRACRMVRYPARGLDVLRDLRAQPRRGERRGRSGRRHAASQRWAEASLARTNGTTRDVLALPVEESCCALARRISRRTRAKVFRRSVEVLGT